MLYPLRFYTEVAPTRTCYIRAILQSQKPFGIACQDLFLFVIGNQTVPYHTANIHCRIADRVVRAEQKPFCATLIYAIPKHPVSKQTGTGQIQVIISAQLHSVQVPLIVFHGVWVRCNEHKIRVFAHHCIHLVIVQRVKIDHHAIPLCRVQNFIKFFAGVASQP